MARAKSSESKIKAEALSIRDLFLLGRFEPARAQREYQWGPAQWRDLLSDFVQALRFSGKDPEPDAEVSVRSARGRDESEGEPVSDAPSPKILKTAGKLEQYYLGHIVLMPRQTADQYFIYDGQQRFTTRTIHLSAIRDVKAGRPVWVPIQAVLRTPHPPAFHA